MVARLVVQLGLTALVDPLRCVVLRRRWRRLGSSVAVELELKGGAGSGNEEEGSGARQTVQTQ